MFKVHKTLNYSLITLLNISKHFMFKVHKEKNTVEVEIQWFQNISCLRFIISFHESQRFGFRFQNISCLRFIGKIHCWIYGIFGISKHFMFKVHSYNFKLYELIIPYFFQYYKFFIYFYQVNSFFLSIFLNVHIFLV